MKIPAILSAVICIAMLTAISWGEAGDSLTTNTQTIHAIYPGLASGALTYATLGDLADNQILKCGTLVITRNDLEKAMAEIPQNARGEINSNLFFLLEQRATDDLLTRLAQEKPQNAPQDGKAVSAMESVRSYLMGVVADVKVNDAEVAGFYEENKDMCGGATLDQVRGQLKQYVLQQKQQEVVAEHIRTLGQRQPIIVSAEWVRKHAALAMDNPVDKARRSGKPSLVDFGADGCRPCDMMAPILQNLRVKYAGKVNIEFVHVREKQVLAARYGIQSIPVQILFDKNGKEAWRHTGFIPQTEIESRFAELGIR